MRRRGVYCCIVGAGAARQAFSPVLFLTLEVGVVPMLPIPLPFWKELGLVL